MDLSQWMEPRTLSQSASLTCTSEPVEQIGRSVSVLHDAGFARVILRANPPSLSRWIADLPDAAPGSPDLWIDPFGNLATRFLLDHPDGATRRLGLIPCGSVEQAVRMEDDPETMGVYCLSLREGNRINGLEIWQGADADMDSADRLVAVRLIASPPSLETLDFTRSDLVPAFLELAKMAGVADLPRKGFSTLLFPLPPAAGASESAVPWSTDLPALFRERWNDDLTAHLPLLWFEGPGSAQLRCRFWSILADLFEQRFLLPLKEWCHAQELALGLETSGQEAPIRTAWGSASRLLSNADAVLHRPFNRSAGRSGVIEIASLARQIGISIVLEDIAPGCLEAPDLNRIYAGAYEAAADGADGALALNAVASFLGDGKRIAGPMSFCEHQPWAPEIANRNREVNRLSALFSQGRPDREIAVLMPSEPVLSLCAACLPEGWGISGPKGAMSPDLAEIEKRFQQTIAALRNQQIAFDLIDEEIFARHGDAEANMLRVGKAEYSTLVIPPASNWRRETLKKIRRFTRKGGCVVAIQPWAPLADFESHTLFETLEEEHANFFAVERAGRAACVVLNRIAPQELQIRSLDEAGTESLVAQSRRTDTHHLFLVSNTSSRTGILARTTLNAKGAVRALDPATPRIGLIETSQERGAQVFDFHYPPGESVIFAVGGERDLTDSAWQAMPRATSAVALESTWAFRRLDPNLMPLENCRVVLDGQPAENLQPLAFVRAQLRGKTTAQRVSLVFPFDSGLGEEAGMLHVIVEPNIDQRILLNGQPLEFEEENCLLDPAFLACDASGHLRKGGNELEISFQPGPDTRIESPILAGDFAVEISDRGKTSLISEPETLRNGSWTDQGYPFYAGTMAYHQQFAFDREDGKRYFLSLPEAAGAIFRIRIGEQNLIMLPCSGPRLEITRLARPGINELEIHVVGSVANLHGPIHLAEKLRNDPSAGIEAYDSLPAEDRRLWTSRPRLFSQGLLQGATLETFDPAAQPKPSRKSAKPEDGDAVDDEGDQLQPDIPETQQDDSIRASEGGDDADEWDADEWDEDEEDEYEDDDEFDDED